MFASKTPRDLNHDPAPWKAFDPLVGVYRRSADKFRADAEFLPQSGFDHRQHNEPNLILVEVRRTGESATEWIETFEENDAFRDDLYADFDTEVITHAYKVLIRLANLERNGEN